MQEHLTSSQQGANAPRSDTLLVDARTLALNREGKLSPEQLQQFSKGISLARWLLYPVGVSLSIIVFSLLILLIFAFTINWIGLLIVGGLLYALVSWVTADDFFKGRAFQAAERAPVVTRIGEVVWDQRKKKQCVKIDGRSYHAIRALPESGLYLCYCLSSVKYVVSAAPLAEADLPPLPVSSPVAHFLDYHSPLESASDRALRQILLTSLARNLTFDKADLSANARGHLSCWQFIRRALPPSFHAFKRVVVVFPIAAAGSMFGLILLQNQFVFSLFTVLQEHMHLTDSNGEVLLFFDLFVFSPAVLFLLYLLKRGIPYIPLIFNWRVITIDGLVAQKGIAPPHSLYKEAEGVELATEQVLGVPDGAGSIFSPGIQYRFYMHAPTFDIVSALPLEWSSAQDSSIQVTHQAL